MKRIPLLLIALLATALAFADNVSQKEAYSIALDFAKKHNMTMKTQRPTMAAKRRGASPAAAAYYVFNMGAKTDGFVIVSGDDSTTPVLGYSTTGCYDDNDVPDGLKWLLDTYAKCIEAQATTTSTASVTAPQTRAAGPAIAPLIKTQWNQGQPYNLLCPGGGMGGHMPTGCVATAMAQILNYWQCPTGPTPEIPAYNFGLVRYDALPSTTFDWNKMQLTYDYNDTGESAMEVAKLMEYCGHAVKMYYNEGGSSASLSPNDLVKYFGFSNQATSLSRTNLSTQQWENIIYNELQAGRPVLYAGRPYDTSKAGHQFICDGYDGDAYFHFNWGWGGAADGYFSLSALMPYGGTEGNNYNSYQSIIYKVMPAKEGETVSNALTTYGNITLDGSTTVTRRNSGVTFNNLPTVSVNYSNSGYDETSYQMGLALYSGDNLIGIIRSWTYTQDLPAGYYVTYSKISLTSDLWKNLGDGTYRIVPVSRVNNSQADDDNPFLPCKGSDIKYVEAIISGNTMTLTVQPKTNGVGVYSISDFSIDGKMKAGRSVMMNFKLKNTGTGGSEVPLNITIGNSYSNAMTAYCDPGKTEDYKVTATLPDAGDNVLTILNINDSTVLYTENLTVAAAPKAALNGSITIKAPQKGTETGMLVPFDMELNNLSETDYDDDIEVVVFNAKGTIVRNFTVPVKVPARATVTVPVTMDNIESSNEDYQIYTYYYYGLDENSLAHGTFNTNAAFLEAQEHDYGDVAHLPETMTATVSNVGQGVFQGDLLVRMGTTRYGFFDVYEVDTVKAEIPVGGTYEVSMKPDLFRYAGSGEYSMRVYYRSTGSQNFDKYLEVARYNVKEGTDQYLSIERVGTGWYDKTLTVKYYNRGSNDYDNVVGLSIDYYSDATKTRVSQMLNLSKLVYIPAGDSVVVDYDLSALGLKGRYLGRYTYVERNERTTYSNFNMYVAESDYLEASNFSINGTAIKGRTATLHYTVKNSSDHELLFPYTFKVGEKTISGFAEYYIPANDSVECELSFDLDEAGTLPVSFYNGDMWLAEKLYSGTLVVRDITSNKLSGTTEIKKVEKNDDGSYTVTADLHITNELDTRFDDVLGSYCRYYYRSNGQNTCDTLMNVVIEPHETVVIPVIFKLEEFYEKRDNVDMECYYYDMNNKTYFNKTAFNLLPLTGIRNVYVDGNDEVKVYDLSGRYVGSLKRNELNNRLKKGVYVVGSKKVMIK